MAIKLNAVEGLFIEVEGLDGQIKKFDVWETSRQLEKNDADARLNAEPGILIDPLCDSLRKTFGYPTLAEVDALQTDGANQVAAPQTLNPQQCVVLRKALSDKAEEVMSGKKQPSRAQNS